MENEYLSDLADISPSLAFVTFICLAIYRAIMNIFLAIYNAVMGVYLVMCNTLTEILSLVSTATDRICDAGKKTKQYSSDWISQLYNKFYACLDESTGYLLAYFGWTLAISLAYYRSIFHFDLPSWAAVERFWYASWSSLLNLMYQVCNSTEGPAINILGINITSYLLDACSSIKGIAKSAKETILPTLLPLMGLALLIALYRSDADLFNIISTVFIMAVNFQIYIVSFVFDIIHVIAVFGVFVGEFFYKLADAFTALHTYSQAVVYEDLESFWFMRSTAIMSSLCSVLVFALLYLATRLVTSLIPRARSFIERFGATTVHEVENVEENESSQPSQNSEVIDEQIDVSEEVPPTTEQAEEVMPRQSKLILTQSGQQTWPAKPKFHQPLIPASRPRHKHPSLAL